MIKLLAPFQITQKRDVKHKYQDPFDPDYKLSNYGRPVALEPSKFTTVHIDALDFTYDTESEEIVRELLQTVKKFVDHTNR